MSTEIHTPACLEEQKERIALRLAWFARFPKACRRCDGLGYIGGSSIPNYYDGSIDNPDPCPLCLNLGLCPRCGEATIDPETGEGYHQKECSSCGWTGEGTEDTVPTELEYCGCFDSPGDDLPYSEQSLTSEYDFTADDMAYDAVRERRFR